MQTDAQKLTAVEAALRRWHTRLTRATNAIRKLEAKRRRLTPKSGWVEVVQKTLADRPREHTKVRLSSGEVVGIKTDSEIPLPELDAFFLPDRPKALVHRDDLAAMPSNQPKGDGLDIPPAFKRVEEVKPASGSPGPKLLSDMINKPFIDAAKKKRLAAMEAKRQGRVRFGPTDMPLSGKDALNAIKAVKAKKSQSK